jgi:hypothetical protein
MLQPPKVPVVLGILHINPPIVSSVDLIYSRITRIEYLQTSLVTLDREVIMVGDGEGEIMDEYRKSRLIHAQNLLKIMERDLETDDHAP